MSQNPICIDCARHLVQRICILHNFCCMACINILSHEQVRNADRCQLCADLPAGSPIICAKEDSCIRICSDLGRWNNRLTTIPCLILGIIIVHIGNGIDVLHFKARQIKFGGRARTEHQPFLFFAAHCLHMICCFLQSFFQAPHPIVVRHYMGLLPSVSKRLSVTNEISIAPFTEDRTSSNIEAISIFSSSQRLSGFSVGSSGSA